MSYKKRETLSKILDMIDEWRAAGSMEHWQYAELFDVADEALVEPLRNCDVGTADEQVKRHDKFCAASIAGCHGVSTNDCVCCYARWAQMPYESKDQNADNS